MNNKHSFEHPHRVIKLSQSTVLYRLRRFSLRKWHKSIPQLNQEQRMVAAHVLIQFFGFSVSEVVKALLSSKPTIYRDLSAMKVALRRKSIQELISELHFFILNPPYGVY